MRRLLILIAFCFVALMMRGEDDGVVEFTHHRASITGALTTSDAYQVQFSYHYMIWPCLGAGGGVGVWKNWYENGRASGPAWSIEDDDNKPTNIYLRPSVVLKTPAVNVADIAFSLYAEPGVMLCVPYQRVCIEKTAGPAVVDYDYISTTRGQWLAIDLHLGINADIGSCGFSIGYLVSNLDIYRQYRHLSYGGVSFAKFYPGRNLMQGAYLTLSYNF